MTKTTNTIKPKLSENVCDGCDKQFEMGPNQYSGDKEDIAAEIEIAPDVIVTVCGSTKNNYHYYRHETRYAPRVGCLRKAFEKKNACPGCGDEREGGEGAFSPVCGDCADHIERAKTVLGDRPSMYSLNTSLIASHYPASSSYDYGKGQTPSDFADKLLSLIARCAAAKGPRKGPDDDLHGHHGVPLPREGRGGSFGRVAVELDEAQHAAVEELGAAIKTFTDAMYHQGRRDGRDLLGGLASGAVSISDFADKHQSWNEEEEGDAD